MRVNFFTTANGSKRTPSRGVLGRFRQDKRGTTAIEFAIVGLPFLMFCFGVMGYGLYFFTNTALEYSVESESRKIRTGQAQTAALTQAGFKTKICQAAGTFLDCSGAGDKLKVHIQSSANWAGIAPTPCVSNGSLTASAATGASQVSAASGGARQVVLVTVCYEWTLAKSLPFLLLGNMGNGSSAIQAVATFRTEPYQ